MAKGSSMIPSFSLTKPALLAAIAYVIMAFTIILPFNIGDGYHYSFGYRLLLLLILLIPIGLSIYSVNCMYVGKCYVWSWVNAVVLAVWVLLFVLAVLLSNARMVDEQEQVEGFAPVRLPDNRRVRQDR